MKQVLLVAGLLLGPAAVAVAQQPTTPTKPVTTAGLSLSDAIAVAREKNPAFRQAQNNLAPAAWGVRGAYSSLLIPSIIASGGMSYTGPGSQTFLSSSFTQSVSTVSSFYDVGLSWQLSGSTLSQPGLAKAQQRAADADVAGAENALITGIKQQYLTVLQARAQADLAQKTLQRNEEFLKLAQARYGVGQATLIDVRQAQVARGQAEVGLLRAQTLVNVEKLRLFEQMGVTPPLDVAAVQLTDSFSVQTPEWQLADLLTMAEQQNPALKALRAREGAAAWNVRAATSSYGPALSLSAGTTWRTEFASKDFTGFRYTPVIEAGLSFRGDPILRSGSVDIHKMFAQQWNADNAGSAGTEGSSFCDRNLALCIVGGIVGGIVVIGAVVALAVAAKCSTSLCGVPGE